MWRWKMLDKLKEKNLELLKKYQQNGDLKNETIQKTIMQLLSYDDCFFKLSIEQAYAVFKELNVKPEEFQKIYLQLTKPKN